MHGQQYFGPGPGWAFARLFTNFRTGVGQKFSGIGRHSGSFFTAFLALNFQRNDKMRVELLDYELELDKKVEFGKNC